MEAKVKVKCFLGFHDWVLHHHIDYFGTWRWCEQCDRKEQQKRNKHGVLFWKQFSFLKGNKG